MRTQCVDGRRYLLIDLDDPAVEINGLTARIAELQPEPTEPESDLTDLPEAEPESDETAV